MSYIKIENMTKKIKDNLILDNINLDLEKGKIYGFIGRNGSGKSMLFRAIVGLIKPTEGRILIGGKELGKEFDFPPSCGVIIETPGFWNELSGFKNLKNIAMIKNKIDDSKISQAMINVGLDPNDKRPFRKYSLGMKQKLALAQALMESPELVVLDEPTNGLDEETVDKIRKLLLIEKEKGVTILIASHNKEDINLLCDEKFKINQGKISKIEQGE